MPQERAVDAESLRRSARLRDPGHGKDAWRNATSPTTAVRGPGAQLWTSCGPRRHRNRVCALLPECMKNASAALQAEAAGDSPERRRLLRPEAARAPAGCREGWRPWSIADPSLKTSQRARQAPGRSHHDRPRRFAGRGSRRVRGQARCRYRRAEAGKRRCSHAGMVRDRFAGRLRGGAVPGLRHPGRRNR